VPGELLRAPSPPVGSGEEEARARCCGLFRLNFEAASERQKASLRTAGLSAYNGGSSSLGGAKLTSLNVQSSREARAQSFFFFVKTSEKVV
jgi:hypothetical protein